MSSGREGQPSEPSQVNQAIPLFSSRTILVCCLMLICLTLAGFGASRIADASHHDDSTEEAAITVKARGASSPRSLTALPFAQDAGNQVAAGAQDRLASLVTDAPTQDYAYLSVPCVMQYPELPTGCESVALTNALLYYGFDLEKTTIADEWLPLSDEDFVYAFLGSPYDPGGNSCMAPCIELTANAYLDAQGAQWEAVDVTGLGVSSILSLVEQGYPVIIWSAIDLMDAGDPYLEQYENSILYGLYTFSHCVVACGFDLEEGVIFVSDSLLGETTYAIDEFTFSYEQLGSQAVVII